MIEGTTTVALGFVAFAELFTVLELLVSTFGTVIEAVLFPLEVVGSFEPPPPPQLQAVNPSITAVANNVFENVNFIIRSLWLIKNFVYVIQLKIALTL